MKRKRLEENIMLFEEWKDSDDYLIQSWFVNKDRECRKWFKSDILKGFQFIDFQWTPSDTYLIYTGHLEFMEKEIEYKLDIVVDYEQVKDGKVEEFNVVLSGYTINDFVMIGQIKDQIKNSDFTADLLASQIAKFKKEFPMDKRDLAIDDEAADDGESNNESIVATSILGGMGIISLSIAGVKKVFDLINNKLAKKMNKLAKEYFEHILNKPDNTEIEITEYDDKFIIKIIPFTSDNDEKLSVDLKLLKSKKLELPSGSIIDLSDYDYNLFLDIIMIYHK